MKVYLAIASLLLSGVACAGDTPAMQLWVTSPIGASDGSHCAIQEPLPTTTPTLTERDVIAWKSPEWQLNNTNFPKGRALVLVDHCFVLAINGKEITRGLVLSSHSARLSRLPTLYLTGTATGLWASLYSVGYGYGNSPVFLNQDLMRVLRAIPADSSSPEKE